MTILETLYIIFKSDASDIKKGADEAKRSTDDLETSLKKTDKGASNVATSFSSIANAAAGALTAVISIGTIVSAIAGATKRASELGLLSKQLGISTEALDVWGAAVVKVGGTTDSFQKSIEGLSKTFNISGQRALDLLPRLADSFSKVSFQRAKAFGSKLGIDEGTIMLLQRGRREMDAIIARQKELGVVTKQDAEIAQKFNQQWQDTDRILKSFYTVVASSILPVLTRMGKTLENTARYFRGHAELIKGGLVGIGVALLPILAVVAATYAPFIATALAIGAIGAAFALAYDDLKAFERGNDSVIGRMLKGWPEIAKAIKFVLDLIKQLSSAIRSLPDWGNDAKAKKDFNAFFNPAREAVNAASNSPIAASSSNSIINGGASNKSTVVNTGPITIQTAATDAQGISSGFAGSLRDMLQQANGGLDDGRVA